MVIRRLQICRLSSGYAAAGAARKPADPLSQFIRRIDAAPSSGQMRVSLVSIPEAFSYELRWAQTARAGETPAPWTFQPVGKTRPPVLVTGLTPGVMYGFQVRALTNSGYTDWSDPISRIAT